ncbi:MAG: protein kinase [Archangiaceae bacterium]|nr:protein kinase [Archangiaceae bacterium]
MTSGGQKSWAAGHQVGRYVLQRVIARGGMAELWLAQQPGPRDFAREVVIKRILTEGPMTADFEQLFFDEAKVASQLNHPNIVQVFEFDEFEGTPYLVMESLNGDTLGALMRKVALRGEALPPKLAVAIVLRCAQGLGSAHRKLGPDGKPLLVVHRDVSPQNIFVTRDGLVKVLDFGIARAVGRVTTTAVGMVRGKPHYMAPEQARGNAVAASDVFSLGVVLFELLTGRRLYGDADHLDVFRQLVLGETPTPGPMDVNRAVPADLDALVRKMMERRLEHRFFDGVVCAEALEEWQRRNQVSMSDHALSQWVQSLDGAGAATVPIPAVTAAMLAEASHRDRGPGAVAGVRAVPPFDTTARGTDPAAPAAARPSAPRPSVPSRGASSAATVIEPAVSPELVEAARRGPGSDAGARVADPSRRSPGSDAAAGAVPVESSRGALASQGAARAADPSRRSPGSDAAAGAAPVEPSRGALASQGAAAAASREGVASRGAAPAAAPVESSHASREGVVSRGAAPAAAPLESSHASREGVASRGAAPAAAPVESALSRQGVASRGAAPAAAPVESSHASREGVVSRGAAPAAAPVSSSTATVVEPSRLIPAAETRVEQPVSSTVVLSTPVAPRVAAPPVSSTMLVSEPVAPRVAAPPVSSAMLVSEPVAPRAAPSSAPTAPAPARGSSRGVVIGVLVAVAVAGIALLAFALGRPEERVSIEASPVPPPPPKPVAALAAEPSPAAPTPATIELKLSTKPTDVQVEVDGLLVGHTPLALKGRDGDVVLVSLSAPGYVKMERKILLSRQLSELKLELEKVRAVKPKPDPKELKDPYSSDLVGDPY